MDNIKICHCTVDDVALLCGDKVVPSDSSQHGIMAAMATDNGNPVAVIILAEQQSCGDSRLTLSFLFVLPAYRRKHIASRLWWFICQELPKGIKLVVARCFLAKDDENVDGFLRSMGFDRTEKNRTRVRICDTEWLWNVQPKLVKMGKRQNSFTFKLGQELSETEWVTINEAVSELDRFNRFAAIYKGMNGNILVFYGVNGDLMGWIVFQWRRDGYIELAVTYILPKYRNYRWVFSFYTVTAEFVKRYKPDCKGLIFYFDTFDVALKRFYERLLAQAEVKTCHEYQYVVVLSGNRL